MVTETRETMAQVFEAMTNNCRNVMDAGMRTQEAFFKTAGQTCRNPLGFDTFFARGEKFAREFVPFVGKGMETMADTFNTSFRAGIEAFKTACDATLRNDESDFYKKSRRVLDATFDAVRTNVDAFSNAGTKTMDNWSTFCGSTCSEETTARQAPKPATK